MFSLLITRVRVVKRLTWLLFSQVDRDYENSVNDLFRAWEVLWNWGIFRRKFANYSRTQSLQIPWKFTIISLTNPTRNSVNPFNPNHTIRDRIFLIADKLEKPVDFSAQKMWEKLIKRPKMTTTCWFPIHLSILMLKYQISIEIVGRINFSSWLLSWFFSLDLWK